MLSWQSSKQPWCKLVKNKIIIIMAMIKCYISRETQVLADEIYDSNKESFSLIYFSCSSSFSSSSLKNNNCMTELLKEPERQMMSFSLYASLGTIAKVTTLPANPF